MAVSPQDHAAHTGLLNSVRSGFGIPSLVSGLADKAMGVTRFTNPNAGKAPAAPQVKGVSADRTPPFKFADKQNTFGVPNAK